jgi:uncharacterized protein
VNCPVCTKPMIAIELSEVEIDYCLACQGIWLDVGEMELLLGDPVRAAALVDSFHPAEDTGARIKCPICLRKMEKVHLSPEKEPVVVDRCRRRHGLWFDKGELPRILAASSFDPEHKVEKLLAEAFGHKYKENSREN